MPLFSKKKTSETDPGPSTNPNYRDRQIEDRNRNREIQRKDEQTQETLSEGAKKESPNLWRNQAEAREQRDRKQDENQKPLDSKDPWSGDAGLSPPSKTREKLDRKGGY